MSQEQQAHAASDGMEACPHAQKARESGKDDQSCGFSAQMMEAARTSSGFHVGSYSSSSAQNEQQLSKHREVSSIPKADYNPAHQDQKIERWQYPSEDMYFRAMKRKGWEPEAEQMGTIVAIHNKVNEQSWAEVMKWEVEHKYVFAISLARRHGHDTKPKTLV